MSINYSPNMNLPVPGVGNEAGPNYATDVNNSLTIIDQHNHTPGSGVLVPVAGLNINADLPLGDNNLTQARTLRLLAQVSTPSTPSDLLELYASGVDLYFIDGSGNSIRITQSGSLAGAPGTITGLPSGTASASYAAGTFVFQAATATPADIDGGSFILRNNVANSNGLTLSPPNAMGANYSLTLPPLPSSQKIMTLDSSGNMVADYVVDNSTLVISSNTIEVASGGIGTAQIANGAVTNSQMAANSVTTSNIVDGSISTPKLVNNNVTLPKLALVTQIISSSCGSSTTTSTSFSQITNFSIGITLTGGRTVDIIVIPDGSPTDGRIVLDSGSTPVPNARGFIRLKRNGTVIGFTEVSMNGFVVGSPPAEISFPGNLRYIDTGAGAGSNTYSMEFTVDSGGTTLTFVNLILVAREV